MKNRLIVVLILLGTLTAHQLYSQKKGKTPKGKTQQQIRDTIQVSNIGTTFRAILPKGYSNPKIDSTVFSTEFGDTQMHAAIAENKQGACMIGFYDFFSEYFAGKTEGDALDSLQMQIMGNMEGKMLRQYRMMLTGKKVKRTDNGERAKDDITLQSRTTYFSTTTNDKTKKTMYWRFALILDRPRIYQIAITSSDKRSLDKPEVNAFFDSLRIISNE